MINLTQLFADHFSSGVDLAVRSGLVLVIAMFVTLLMRRSSAAARHFVWTTAVVGVLALPAVSMFLPFQVGIPVIIPARASAHQLPAPTDILTVEAPLLAVATPAEQAEAERPDILPRDDVRKPFSIPDPSEVAPMPAPAPPISWAQIVVNVWLVGVVVCSLPWILGCFSLWLLRESGKPLPADLSRELQELAASVLDGRRVVGLQSASRTIPMTWGLWESVVLLPADAPNWSAERLRLVLLHELAHVRRRDCLVQMLGQIVRAIHWFNPLAWWALSRLRLEQEQACDDSVLNSGAAAEDYAAELLSVTARLPRMSWDTAVALAMGRASRLEQRLNAILDDRRNRRTPSIRGVVAGLSLLSGLIVTLAIVQPREVRSEPPAIERVQTVELRKESPQVAQKTEPRVVQVEPVKKDEKTAEAAAKDQKDISLSAVISMIESNSVHNVNSTALNEAAIRGMMDSLKDPYSTYFSAEQLQEFQRQIEGRLVGIGTMLSASTGKLVVEGVLPNSPALAGGLRRGDEILGVNGQPAGKLEDTVKAIRGPSGSEVTLKIRRDAKDEMTLTFRRQDLKLSAVRGLTLNEQGQWQHWLDAAEKLAYVQVTQFDATTQADLKAAVQSVVDQGCKGLVLDLRMNPGGVLPVCVEVAQLFMKDKVVVQTKGRTAQQNQSFNTGAAVVYPDLPLVIVVDRNTASAAEVLTAALKDNGRAIVVGERTFGKGSIQSILPIVSDGPAIKLTVAQMVSPSGMVLHHEPGAKQWGVDPNDGYFIPTTAETRRTRLTKQAERQGGTQKLPAGVTAAEIEKDWADPALAAALQSLQAKAKSGEFAKSGHPVAELHAQLAQQDELRKQRDEFRKKLDQLNAELDDNK